MNPIRIIPTRLDSRPHAVVIGSCILGAMLSYSPMASADDYISETVTNATGSSQSQLNVVLSGNVGGNIDGTHNPFGAFGIVSSFYYSGNNTTTFSFSGTGIANLSTATVGLSDTIADQVIGKYWGPPSTNGVSLGMQLPAPTITTKFGPTGGTPMYLVFFANFSFAGGTMAGEWYEQPVNAGESVEFQLFNDDIANQPMYIFDAKYFVSDTQIPLDDLNNIYEPPTGSNFQPLPGITDGEQITSGTHIEAANISVPEPSTAALLLAGIPMLLAWRQWSGRKA